MLWNGVREVPHHSARFGVAKGVATVVFHEHPNHAARVVGLPVVALGQCFFSIGEFIPPAQFLEQHMVKFGVTGGDVCAQ